MALLEVICRHEHDARRAAEGGADRIELLGSLDDGGMSPEPVILARTVSAVDIPVRPMVRLRQGFSTDGGEIARLRGLIESYLDSGAEGVVMGFLDADTEVDVGVMTLLAGTPPCRWTFHRAIDVTLRPRDAWVTVMQLPGVDQVLTAGSSLDVEHGLDELISMARSSPRAAELVMAGGGLAPEHVPWLMRAGVRAFHIGRPARPQGSYKAWVDAGLVHSWRTLLDSLD
ncbi:CutC family protein [Acidipropionibacterium acidipropionici ATCC 4875]|uniref:Copper homeostasis protein cutC homolog n=1 Tax=Acidipropionibacterium acidipropionici (strain ATCC 4875 / DSM 20272 / JCM 6432 / NBRC 12425 / NCIMB 8070 / 4) TaxID=1171373 RepID=K7RLG6_ACIA4|nr:copper homeostasis protein CutC [Acidipropionibacterium acidipropionici]AFV88749.1 CutC family protein [Acidipropionibacterium acidipropionici ATCC 4875]ALN13946.1 copper homeostasis protein CutC [Acidipropionibacterium acidipropionici]APZ10287.1 copper homeostasis protein CutC [Acidipropionibacterium acidipropionici]